eukprot:GHVN01000716.1.p1 GENE.GHVN01000716.1~~GHVN01000716.1.p1  ORF type:complete len:102 (+),score=9.38 GHVN01000716.1:186-491(+)
MWGGTRELTDINGVLFIFGIPLKLSVFLCIQRQRVKGTTELDPSPSNTPPPILVISHLLKPSILCKGNPASVVLCHSAKQRAYKSSPNTGHPKPITTVNGE